MASTDEEVLICLRNIWVSVFNGLANFMHAQAQKPIKVSKRNFIFRYFIWRLRVDRYILVEIGSQIRGRRVFKNLNPLSNLDQTLHN